MNGRRVLPLLMLLASCGPSRIVPPLRYGNGNVARGANEDPFRSKMPIASVGNVCVVPPSKTTALANGMQIAVVERHGFPSVAARLVFNRDAFSVEQPNRVPLELLSAIIWSPRETGQEADAKCTRAGCWVAAEGMSGNTGELLGRLAGLTVRPVDGIADYARRLESANRSLSLSGLNPGLAYLRNVRVAAFGRTPYGEPELPWPDPTVADLERLRSDVLSPDVATLIVVGDTTLEEVRAEADRQFGPWQPSRRPKGVPRLPEVNGHHVVYVHRAARGDAWGGVVVRGPGRGDRDALPFELAGQLLGGQFSSDIYRVVREDMTAGYLVGGSLEWLPSTSILSLGGLFENAKAIQALATILGFARALRDKGPDATSLLYAKVALRARRRHEWATNAGAAAAIGQATMVGGPVDSCEDDARLDALTAADVKRVAGAYFAEHELNVVVVGSPGQFGSWANVLDLGPVVNRDGFAREDDRPVTPPKPAGPR